MSIKCRDIIEFIENIAPVRLAEEWDNVGLAVGSYDAQVKRVMLCLDVTSEVVEEAARKDVDLLISHHPLIFKAIKNIRVEDSKGSVIHSLIKAGISVYCAHTSLDAADAGINSRLAALLGLSEVGILRKTKAEKLYKIVVFVPEDSIDTVRNAICGAGAGWIGNYSNCSFYTKGTGTFKPLEGANPYIGSAGKLERVTEYRLESVVPEAVLGRVLDAMLKSHPYEEVAYDIYPLELARKEYGMNRIGMLEKPVGLDEFVSLVKDRLKLANVRIIGNSARKIQRVAVAGGSFDGNLDVLEREDVDVLVTGDVKYHDAIDIKERGLCVIDAGHFGTERVILPVLESMLKENFPDIEVTCNTVETDPFIYI